ncbi:LytR/AlgR family response regulator transcription factor [Acutalibacter sp. 1XD8-36]|uniref:LytR/AlgR family response regulator transcription factor n=1 Tax=Acutalibacter sp. 1XD8-36 TaxID=2320852 RepID=UPI00261FFED7|nr:response regulator [Acutalibacter sp. 1XD8-36]
MIKIAICIDGPALRNQAVEMLNTYIHRRSGGPGLTAAFESVPKLLKAMEKGEDFDLYILDELIPGLTGVDMCVRLRELGGSGAIIRLTSDVDRASFRDQAMGCLMKPLKAEEVYRELDRVLDWIAGRQEDKVSVSVRGGVRVLPLSELLYVDLQNRVLHYHNLDGSIAASLTLRTSFQKVVEPLLSDGRFFRCGTSFAVNLHHLRSVEQDSLLLDNGGRVPLTPGMSGEAKRRWASYWRGDPMASPSAG